MQILTFPTFDSLPADVPHKEVAALKQLKRNKAAGLVSIRAEFILDVAGVQLTPARCDIFTFKEVFLNKDSHSSWRTDLIHLIFKSIHLDDPGYHGGGNVVVIFVKLSAMIWEVEISACAEHGKCKAKGQAPFSKEFCTRVQVFKIIQTVAAGTTLCFDLNKHVV